MGAVESAETKNALPLLFGPRLRSDRGKTRRSPQSVVSTSRSLQRTEEDHTNSVLLCLCLIHSCPWWWRWFPVPTGSWGWTASTCARGAGGKRRWPLTSSLTTQAPTAVSLSPLRISPPAPRKKSRRWPTCWSCMSSSDVYTSAPVTAGLHLILNAAARSGQRSAGLSCLHFKWGLGDPQAWPEMICVTKCHLLCNGPSILPWHVCYFKESLCLFGFALKRIDWEILSVLQITSQMPNHPANSFYYPRLRELPPIGSIRVTQQSRSPDRQASMSNHILPNLISQRISGQPSSR